MGTVKAISVASPKERPCLCSISYFLQTALQFRTPGQLSHYSGSSWEAWCFFARNLS